MIISKRVVREKVNAYIKYNSKLGVGFVRIPSEGIAIMVKESIRKRPNGKPYNHALFLWCPPMERFPAAEQEYIGTTWSSSTNALQRATIIAFGLAGVSITSPNWKQANGAA